MTVIVPRTSKYVSWLCRILAVALASAVGAGLGAVALSVGVYLAGYSDRIMPFRSVGAFAGFTTAAVYSGLRLWRHGEFLNERGRCLISALSGAMIAAIQLASSAFGMTLRELTEISSVWIIAWTLLLLLVGRRSKSSSTNPA